MLPVYKASFNQKDQDTIQMVVMR